MKRFLVVAFLCLLAGSAVAQSRAEQRRAKREAEKVRTAQQLDSLIRGGSFIFVAERAITNLPAKPYVSLDGRDFLCITPEKIVSGLPFYGRLYSAPMDASKSPLDFESTKFIYKNVSDQQKGKHLVRIEVQESNTSLASKQFTIVIEAFDDRTAMATVTFNAGSVSTYYGRIEPNNKQ